MQIVYYSQLGKTQQFINNNITTNDPPPIQICEETLLLKTPPYLCIVATYTPMQEIVKRWILSSNHKESLRYVVGIGDIYFGELFCSTSKILSKKFNVPLLRMIDGDGTENDWRIIMESITND